MPFVELARRPTPTHSPTGAPGRLGKRERSAEDSELGEVDDGREVNDEVVEGATSTVRAEGAKKKRFNQEAGPEGRMGATSRAAEGDDGRLGVAEVTGVMPVELAEPKSGMDYVYVYGIFN